MNRFLGSALVVLVLAFPFTAFADLSCSNVTLNANTTANLDTGQIVTSGGDLTWTGSGFTVAGRATDADLTRTQIASMYVGLSGYMTLIQQPQSTFASFFIYLSHAVIPTPAVNDILVFKTNGGNYGAIIVTATSGTSITIDFDTLGVSGGCSIGGGGGGGGTPAGPSITGVVNNYSYVPVGFPNSGIAPGTIFLLFGSGMSDPPPANLALNSSVSPGIPTTWAGATLQVKASDGTTYTPGIYYATPTQIAAVLPSKVGTGAATITVTYKNQTSNSFQFQVVPTALGLSTYFGTGTGLILAVNAANGTIYTYTNSAKPGDTILLFGTGLGADIADSDTVFTGSPHPVNTATKIYFGGVAATPEYAGSSGYPGYNQINVKIPDNAPNDCYVGLVAATGKGITSNFGSLPISASGGQCTSSILGISGTTVSSLIGQSTVKLADVYVSQSTTPKSSTDNTAQTSNLASAIFLKESGAAFSSDTSNGGSAFSIGSCYVKEVVQSGAGGGTLTGLDAGNIGLTGPNGNYTLTELETGTYMWSLPDNAISSSGGAFTYNGSGGADVKSFNTTINFPNPLLNWTNQNADATVNRSQGVTLNWTGGAPGSYVIIRGNSSDANTGANGSFTCIANQSALTFAVPNYVTGSLPAGPGQLSVNNYADYGMFTATGLDVGIKYGFTGTTINATYQ